MCSNVRDDPKYDRPACREKGGRYGKEYIAYFVKKGNKMTRYFATGEGPNKEYDKDIEVFYKASKEGGFPIKNQGECH